jgi:hypothetical protein
VVTNVKPVDPAKKSDATGTGNTTAN